MITLLVLAAAAVLPAPVAASPAGGASYSGTTSQHERMAMTFARGKRHLSRFDAVVHAGCSDGQRDWTHFVLGRGEGSLAVTRGRVGKRIALGRASAPAVGRLSLKARFGRTGVIRGSLSETWRYGDGATCRSGSIAFRLHRGRYAPPRDPREPRAQHPLAGPPTPGLPTPGLPALPPNPPPPPPAPPPPRYPLRGMFFRQSNGGFDVIATRGFNLIDTDPGEVDSLAAGLKGLTWVGDYNRSSCTWGQSDATITSYVKAHVGDSKVGVWFIGDEPWQGGTPHCANAPAQFKQRSDLIHSIDPGGKTLMVIDGNSGQESLDQLPAWKGTTDYQGINAYVCWQAQACHFDWIDTLAHAADAAGLSYWGVPQAFGDPDGQGQLMCVVTNGSEQCGQPRLPTASDIHTEFVHWRGTRMKDYLVFSWRWPDNASSLWLENHPELQGQLQIENESPPPPGDTTPPGATLTSPAHGGRATTATTSARGT